MPDSKMVYTHNVDYQLSVSQKGLFDLRMNKFKAYNRDAVSDTICDNSQLKVDETHSYLTSSGKYFCLYFLKTTKIHGEAMK